MRAPPAPGACLMVVDMLGVVSRSGSWSLPYAKFMRREGKFYEGAPLLLTTVFPFVKMRSSLKVWVVASQHCPLRTMEALMVVFRTNHCPLTVHPPHWMYVIQIALVSHTKTNVSIWSITGSIESFSHSSFMSHIHMFYLASTSVLCEVFYRLLKSITQCGRTRLREGQTLRAQSKN